MRCDSGDESGWLIWTMTPAVLSGIALICIPALAAFGRAKGQKRFGRLIP
jgi:hypothetical protein